MVPKHSYNITHLQLIFSGFLLRGSDGFLFEIGIQGLVFFQQSIFKPLKELLVDLKVFDVLKFA